MMVYRDMTFCTGSGCTKFATCPRALTDQVLEDARKWWGRDETTAPIATFSQPNELECYEEQQEEQR
jgi:hypothetical protein